MESRVEISESARKSVRQQPLAAWNSTATPFPSDRCVHQLFEKGRSRGIPCRQRLLADGFPSRLRNFHTRHHYVLSVFTLFRNELQEHRRDSRNHTSPTV